MKRLLPFMLASLLLLTAAGCGAAEEPVPSSSAPESSSTVSVSDGAETAEEPGGILIAYFSVPEDVDTEGVDAVAGASVVVREGEVLGNTEYMAGIIQQTVGGDLYRIETVEDYPLDHDALVDFAAEEQDAGARPELAGEIEDLGQYDTIFLGYPNWWSDAPMAVYTFVESYDWDGKTLVPFNTSASGGFGRSLSGLEESASGAAILEGISFTERTLGDAQSEVTTWLDELRL